MEGRTAARLVLYEAIRFQENFNSEYCSIPAKI